MWYRPRPTLDGVCVFFLTYLYSVTVELSLFCNVARLNYGKFLKLHISCSPWLSNLPVFAACVRLFLWKKIQLLTPTTSSSVWRTHVHSQDQTWRCAVTGCVANIRALWASHRRSVCSVPATCRLQDTWSSSFRPEVTCRSVNLKSSH